MACLTSEDIHFDSEVHMLSTTAESTPTQGECLPSLTPLISKDAQLTQRLPEWRKAMQMDQDGSACDLIRHSQEPHRAREPGHTSELNHINIAKMSMHQLVATTKQTPQEPLCCGTDNKDPQ